MRKIKETKKKATKNQVEEESINLKSVIKVFIVILVFFIIFYGLTIIVVNRKNSKKKNHNYNNIETKSNDIIISDILTQDEDLYYVIAIKDNKDAYELYTNNMKDKLYNIDLNNALNKGALGEETQVAENPRDIKIGDTTLFVVENHVITESFVGKDEVVNKLKTIAF
jgi:preprotein translocase subunit YajC